jgi:transcriptional regulator with XRE-family HTH domain
MGCSVGAMPDARNRRRSATHRSAYRWMLERLREARQRAGLTQAQAARALGRPQSYVSKCELGERRIDPIDLQELAELYRQALTFFLPPLRK